uniref:Tetratricopeptide repeat protein 17 n=1 Tax=Arion vulgaris TaxID=1028688 RepID=A0A0B7BGE5_9EUPU
MASTITMVLLASFILQRCTITNGSTHWMVTEDGRIQSQADSVYNLRRPYDLVAFMKQEDRASMLNILKKELLTRKDEIDKNEDRDTGLEQKFYRTNPDCIEAGKPLPEFDLYISTVLPLENKGIRAEEHIDLNGSPSTNPRSPDCTVFTDLDFSMHAFEHLEGMKARSNLSGSPELGLKNAITHRENVDDYGHLVYEALNKNKTSWILYNMAAFYWRIKGNPYQAVECIRRALHHSPRLQKDVALISLANILHRARFSNEAAILVHAALEVSKELNVNHFTLGNIYAVLGEYNKSIICFENTLKIQPDFEAASKRKHAVLCHSKLEMALEAQHRSLQRTLKDLKDYQRKHDLYQMQSDKLLAEQVPHEVKVAQHLAYEQLKMREKSAEMDEYCRMVDREGKQVLLCTWSRRSPTLDFDFAFLEEAPEKTNDENISEKFMPGQKTNSKSPNYSQPVKTPLYSKYKKHKNTEADPYMLPSWPTKDICDTYVKKVPDSRNLTTVYLSPENKGFEVKELLTEAQGLEQEGEHPLPWYPPVCVPLMELAEGNPTVYDHLKSVSYAERSRIPLKYNDPSMRKILLDHVNNGFVTEEEVGQRILSALKQNIGPQWILYNLAGLYWRIIGNNYHGIECIRRAIYLSPVQYRDVPLVNLANILYRYGRYDDAIIIMKDALDINDAEPASHFLLGHLLWATRNYTGAAHHYQEVLAADENYPGALDTIRAMKCYLKYHYAAQSAAPQESPANSHSNCQPKPAETESRVICKTENSEEKCIIETRSRNRIADCNGQCTQTCTITPIKVDGCSGDISLENTLIGHCSGKGGKQFSSEQDDMLFSADFTSKLDEVSDYYEKRGLCEGDACSHLRVQGTQRPHTKLEYVEGVLKHQLIFLQVAPSEMQIDADDCIIFNDGTKSAGCNREEFRTYVSVPN